MIDTATEAIPETTNKETINEDLTIKIANLENELNIYKNAIISECKDNNPLFHVKSAELAELFIKHSANVNDKNICNSTPLHYKKNKDVVEIFIKNNANLNEKDDYGCVPIMFYDDIEIIKLMYENGADLSLCDNIGRSVLEYMKDNNREDIIKYINDITTNKEITQELTQETNNDKK